MGISWSGRRRNNNYMQNPPPQYFPSSYYYYTDPPSLPPPPPQPPNYQFATASTPYPPPLHSYYHYSAGYNTNTCNHPNPMTARFNYHPYYANQPNGWSPARPPVALPQPMTSPPPPYVDHQNAKKVRNDVNVHKDTLRLEVDDENPDHNLVSFVFDALFDGSITIFYFAKEESNCRFVPLFPEAYMPVRVPFQKGLGQKFRQPSGTGIDLGFFELSDLAKPSPEEDVFPLVISAETCLSAHSTDEHLDDPNASPHMQITQAVLEKNNNDSFQVRVIRQILWVNGVRYELREIFGIGTSAAEGFDDNDPVEKCVICMTEPKDTAVLPCRHMCMCSECAKALRLQSNKCPICRQSIEELIEIKINNGD